MDVKEKMGELRFYYSATNWPESDREWMSKFVHEDITVLSQTTCLRCGNEAQIRNVDGWYMCICDSCLKLKS